MDYKSSSATMSHRKLLAEIDRVLKKVQEGAKDFEGILAKVNAAASSNQKEKYETDLKKTIKKLQRYRDQIKTWIQSNAIKDKRALVEARKLIESNMEKFKVCEKEMKTKAYSKEGLQQAMQANEEHPADRTRKWIRKSLERLKTQIDGFESKIESTQAKKGRRTEADQVEKLRQAIARHRFHEENLETILRKLDNETLTAEQVDEIRDGVEYYIENNQETDFYEDEEIYDDLVGSRDLISPRDSQEGISGDEEETEEPPSTGAEVGNPPDQEGPPVHDTNAENERQPSPAPVETPPPRVAVPNSHASLRNSQIDLKNYTSTPAETAQAANPPRVTSKDVEPEASVKRSKERNNDSNQNRSVPTAVPPANIGAVRPALAEVGESSATFVENPKNTHGSGGLPSTSDSRVNNQDSIRHASGPSSHRAGTPPQQMQSQASQARSQPHPNDQGQGEATFQLPAPQPQTENTDKARQFPSLMQLSEQQLYKYRERMMGNPNMGSAYHRAASPMERLGIVEAVEDSKNSETFEDAAPATPGTLADLSSATLEMAETQGAPLRKSLQEHPIIPSASFSSVHSPSPILGTASIPSPAPSPSPSSSPSPSPALVSVPAPPLPSVPSPSPPSLAPSPAASGPVPTPSLPPLQPPQSPQTQASLDLGMLEASMEYMPEPLELESRPKQYTPQNPYPTPSYYSSAPSPIFDNPAIFEKFDTDTLFFIFYYQQGTYQQYLAARELKKQSWRYHKKYLTWFQRHEEPKEITNDYEQGTYVYFDYESGWCQRKKTEFTFEYRYLEED